MVLTLNIFIYIISTFTSIHPVRMVCEWVSGLMFGRPVRILVYDALVGFVNFCCKNEAPHNMMLYVMKRKTFNTSCISLCDVVQTW